MSTNSISYTARDYETILSELKSFIKETRPDVYSDFFDSNTGMILVELAALVGDMLSYNMDITAQEIFLATCQRYDSALRFARSVGYTPRSSSPASVFVKATTIPGQVLTYGGTIPKGSSITGSNGLTYELLADAVIPAGSQSSKIELVEGTSYSESFANKNEKNQYVTVSNGIVAQGSWVVYVGSTSSSNNIWTEVPNVSLEVSPTNTYDVRFDTDGRLIVRFGDGVNGQIPNQTITVQYRTCNGFAGNAPIGSIAGTVSANVNSPGTGVVSMTYINKDIELSVSGGTTPHTNEIQAVTSVSTTQAGVLANVPVVSGSLIVTIPQGVNQLVLQDAGNGTFNVLANSTGLVISSSSVAYATGNWSVVATGTFTAGDTILATYSSVNPAAATSTNLTGSAQGGADREGVEDLRNNVPAYLRSQDRLISLDDYRTALKKIPGVALALADRWVSSYTANLIKLNIWAAEAITFTSEDYYGSTIPSTSTSYTRYTQIEDSLVRDVVEYVTPRSIVTVSTSVVQPEMLWVDLYLGDVRYDKAADANVVRKSISEAVINEFQTGDGFNIKISDLYNAIDSVPGVNNLLIERVVLGTQDTSAEIQGSTSGSASISGTLLKTVVVPGSVEISIGVTGAQIVLRDNKSGGFSVTIGTVAIVSSSINYNTGAWTVTFTANLPASQTIYASYRDVYTDYRRDQNVILGGSNDLFGSDKYPPPNINVADPVATPPYLDGKPLQASRDNPTIRTASSYTSSYDSGTGLQTVTVNYATAHGYNAGDTVNVSISPANFSGPQKVLTASSLSWTFAVSVGSLTTLSGTMQTVLKYVASNYAVNDLLTYRKLQDIRNPTASSSFNFYDNTYLYNNEIYYDSVIAPQINTRAINLRRLIFNLIAE